MSATAAVPAAIETAIARRIDFPTWLPAMLVKELRQGLRQRGFVAALVGFQIVMTLFLLFAVAGGAGSGSFNILQGAYWVMIIVQLLVLIPLRGLLALQTELDSRWVDLLMLTRLTPWRIVLGKWISLVVQGALLLVAMLPYGVARYFFGSVDLVGEAQVLAVIFTSSAVLIAIALWSSALPAIARVGLAIGVVWAGFALADSSGVLGAVRLGPVRFGRSSAFMGSTWWLVVFDIGILLLLCLVGAVRRLSPKAESQTALTRLLPFLGLLALPFLRGSDARGQMILTGFFFVFIAALELGRPEEPMEAHWLKWARRGWWGRLIGRLVQPGWASAIEWIMLSAVLAVAAVAAFANLPPAIAGWGFVRRVVLPLLFFAEALIFPVLLLSWMTKHFTHRLVGYLLVFVGANVLAAVSTAAGTWTRLTSAADYILFLLPISSFWASVAGTVRPALPLQALQVLVAVAVLSTAWWRARPYRLQRRRFEAAPTEDPIL